MQKRLLDNLKLKPDILTKHNDAIRLLYESGIFEFLRVYAIPKYAPKSDITEVALSASYSKGFNDCLDFLFEFDKKFLLESPTTDRPIPTYGGLELAVKNKLITEEEANDIRSKFHSNARA